MPPNTRCITRPSCWGNPFIVVSNKANCHEVSVSIESHADKIILSGILNESGPNIFKTKSEASAHAATLFGKLMDKLPQNYPLSDFDRVENIACFCKEGEPCHGDEIIKRLKQ